MELVKICNFLLVFLCLDFELFVLPVFMLHPVYMSPSASLSSAPVVLFLTCSQSFCHQLFVVIILIYSAPKYSDALCDSPITLHVPPGASIVLFLVKFFCK